MQASLAAALNTVSLARWDNGSRSGGVGVEAEVGSARLPEERQLRQHEDPPKPDGIIEEGEPIHALNDGAVAAADDVDLFHGIGLQDALVPLRGELIRHDILEVDVLMACITKGVCEHVRS